MVMMDWLGRMLNLPDQFLFSGLNSRGGGVIQGTASEATLVALLSARAKAINSQKLTNSGIGFDSIQIIIIQNDYLLIYSANVYEIKCLPVWP